MPFHIGHHFLQMLKPIIGGSLQALIWSVLQWLLQNTHVLTYIFNCIFSVLQCLFTWLRFACNCIRCSSINLKRRLTTTYRVFIWILSLVKDFVIITLSHLTDTFMQIVPLQCIFFVCGRIYWIWKLSFITDKNNFAFLIAIAHSHWIPCNSCVGLADRTSPTNVESKSHQVQYPKSKSKSS